jgi:hypothetical protein
MGMTGIGK